MYVSNHVDNTVVQRTVSAARDDTTAAPYPVSYTQCGAIGLVLDIKFPFLKLNPSRFEHDLIRKTTRADSRAPLQYVSMIYRDFEFDILS